MSGTRGEPIEVLAVPWGDYVIAERHGGDTLVFTERWAPRSVKIPDESVPLLAYHKSDRPIGQLTEFVETAAGLVARGYLVGSANDREGISARVAEDLQAEASIGFEPNIDSDVVAAPTSRGGLPLVERRGVRLREVSLVHRGAVTGARVLSLGAPPSTATSTTGTAMPVAGPSPEASQVLADAQAAIDGAEGSYMRAVRDRERVERDRVLADARAGLERGEARRVVERDRVLREARDLVAVGEARKSARPYMSLTDDELAQVRARVSDAIRLESRGGRQLVSEAVLERLRVVDAERRVRGLV